MNSQWLYLDRLNAARDGLQPSGRRLAGVGALTIRQHRPTPCGERARRAWCYTAAGECGIGPCQVKSGSYSHQGSEAPQDGSNVNASHSLATIAIAIAAHICDRSVASVLRHLPARKGGGSEEKWR